MKFKEGDCVTALVYTYHGYGTWQQIRGKFYSMKNGWCQVVQLNGLYFIFRSSDVFRDQGQRLIWPDPSEANDAV